MNYPKFRYELEGHISTRHWVRMETKTPIVMKINNDTSSIVAQLHKIKKVQMRMLGLNMVPPET